MRFQLITLNGAKFDQQVYEVALPTADGRITVLPSHMPLVTIAKPGIIAVRHKAGDADEKLDHFATEGGIIEIAPDSVRILVDEASHSSEIHEDEAQKALVRALELQEQAKDKVALDEAQSLIDRAQVRLQVANLRRRRKN